MDLSPPYILHSPNAHARRSMNHARLAMDILAIGSCLLEICLQAPCRQAIGTDEISSQGGMRAAPAGLICQLLSGQSIAGITDPKPKLGWIVPLEKPSDRQTACQVLAASSRELLATGQSDLWDSGKVKSAESINVEYAGRSLRAARTWYWKVRT